MVIKKLVSSICSLFGLRWRQRIKEPSNYEAIGRFDLSDDAKERENHSPGGGSRIEEAVEGELCCVCLSRVNEGGEERRILPCLHEFHRACIDRWFDVCRKTCPVCRLSLEVKEMTVKREELTEEMVTWFSSFHAAGF